MTKQCKNCKFYNEMDFEQGECRFNPPVIVETLFAKFWHGSEDVTDAVSCATEFPVVVDCQWCGKWECKGD